MKTYLEYSDISLMEVAAKSPRDRLLIRLLSRLGCRISEILSIRISDIDFEQNTVTILHLKRRINVSCSSCRAKLGSRHQYCHVCGDRISEITKHQQEKRRRRVLPIDPKSVDMIEEYLHHNKCYQDDNGLLFHIGCHRAWQVVKKCAEKAGIPCLIKPESGRMRGASPYRLRDAFSVNAMKLDGSSDGLRLLQEHLGHQSIATTMKYRKVSGDEHRDWYQRLWNTSHA